MIISGPVVTSKEELMDIFRDLIEKRKQKLRYGDYSDFVKERNK